MKMRKLNRKTISFDKKFLRKLVEDPNSCVHIQKDFKRLPIHPFRLTDINTCIKDIFQTQIAKYDEKLNGILLGYQNVVLLECDSGTFDGSFTHMDIEAEFYVFKPIIGSILKGIVNKRSKDHIGCLVYNTFNVSLPRPQDEETWLGQKINLGSEVEFKINFTNMDSKLPYIRGEMLSIINDGEFAGDDSFLQENNKIKFNDSDNEECTKKLKKKHKKAKHKEFEELNEDDFDEVKVKKLKKNKKERKFEENSVEIEEKKVKKKHKKINLDLGQLESEETKTIKLKRKKSKDKNESKIESLNQYNEDNNIDEEEIINSSKKRKRKLEDETDKFNESLTQDNSIDNKSKKNKKRKEINEDLNQSNDNEKVKRKKNKSKDKDDFLESLMHSIDDEFDPKIKKHKKHKHKKDEENNRKNDEDGTQEEIDGKKHKKKEKNRLSF